MAVVAALDRLAAFLGLDFLGFVCKYCPLITALVGFAWFFRMRWLTAVAEYTSAFPAGITIGATRDRKYSYLRSHALGSELRRKGVDIVLTPQISPLGRFPERGRNWGSFSPDTYLCGEMVARAIRGIQDSEVIATTRHFIANEQEHFRFTLESDQNNFAIKDDISANLNDRTMHEIYLWQDKIIESLC